jgi:succinoglycan biosynthesis transport protein ExoP
VAPVESAHQEFQWISDVKDGVTQLRAGARTIVLVSLVFVAGAIAYLVIVPARYQASTEIFIDPRGLQVVQNDVTPRSETDESAVSLVESQSRVAQSIPVLRSVVQSLGLDHDPEFNRPPGLLGRLLQFLSPGPDEDASTQATRKLERLVDVSRLSRSYVIVIAARSKNPAKAAQIANAIADTYIEHEVNARTNSAHRVEAAMTSRHKELAERLRNSEDAIESFKAHNNLIGSASRLISDQQLEELNTRISAEHANVVQQRARVEQIDRLLRQGAEPDAIPEAVRSATIASLRSQFAQVVRMQATASTLLGPRHPDVRVLQQQRDAYRRLIADELQRIADATRIEYRRALSSEQGLKNDFGSPRNTTIRSNEAMVRLRELERLAESNREIYRAFLMRAKEIGIQGGVDTSNTRVISAAIQPIRPVGPRLVLVPMALLAGLGLSGWYVWMFGRRPQRTTHS